MSQVAEAEALKAYLHRYRTDLPSVMEELLRLPHRDRKSHVVPLKLFPGQRKLYEHIQNIRCFQLARQTIPGTDPWRFLRHPMKLQKGFRERYEQIQEIGPFEFLFEAIREHEVELTDGPVRTAIGKCRRGGFSSFIAGMMTLEANFNRYFRGAVMAHKGDNATSIFGYHRDFIGEWPRVPEFLGKLKINRSKESDGGYKWENGSIILVQTAGGHGAGLGTQQDIYHFSEAAHYKDYRECSGALSAAPPHAWVFEESTANGPAGGYYDRWMGALDLEDAIQAYDIGAHEVIADWNGYFRFFYSWLEEPEYRETVYDFEQEQFELDRLDPVEQALVTNHRATPEQLKWRRNKMKVFGTGGESLDEDSGLTPEQWFHQEFPTTPDEMFQSTGSLVFPIAKINEMKLKASGMEPEGSLRLLDAGMPVVVRPHLANLQIWHQPEPGKEYAIGADIAEGLAHGDFSVASVLDRCDGTVGKEAAMWRGKIPPKQFADVLVTLCELYNNAYLVPEVNNHGLATCERVVNDLRYHNVYHRRTLDMVRGRGLDDRGGFRFGFSTDRKSKPQIIWLLERAIREGLIDIYSRQALKELGIYQNDDGKLGAPSGEKDDCVMALALAWFGQEKGPPIDQIEVLRAVRRATMDDSTRAFHDDVEKLIAAEGRRAGGRRKDWQKWV